MSVELLLARLEGVRPTGPGRWVARCPAHADRSPSLSVRELDDGRLLIHDFAGCPPDAILAAVGLAWGALYPPRDPACTHVRRGPPVPYADALRCIAAEVWHVLICAARIEAGKPLDRSELDRLVRAVDRITEAARVTRLAA